jgi:nucleoside-diphosphate-sugar epimerase
MKAVITGAAGFIGSHLSEYLVNAGHTVTGIDVFTDYYPREIKERNLAALRANSRFTLHERALADADWPRLLDGVSWVFHLAAQAGVRKSWGRDFRVYTENNVEGTQILLEACKGRPVDRRCMRRAHRFTARMCCWRCGKTPGRSRYRPTV